MIFTTDKAVDESWAFSYRRQAIPGLQSRGSLTQRKLEDETPRRHEEHGARDADDPDETRRADTVRNAESHEASQTLSQQERAEILEEYLAQAGRRGWRVEGKGDYIAFLVSGKPVNHKLHAVLTLLTAGMWLPVWAGISIFGGQKRTLVRVDEQGNLHGPQTRQ